MQRLPWRRGSAIVFGLLITMGTAAVVGGSEWCAADCNDNGRVTIDELVRGIDIALGSRAGDDCPGIDANGDGQVAIDELLRAVTQALSGCTAPGGTVTATATASSSDTPRPTRTRIPSATATESPTLPPTATATGTPTLTHTPTPTFTLGSGAISIAEAVARDGRGVALRLGQSVTTEGVLTVAAGVFANAKLKIFAQSGAAGIMVYHQSSSLVPTFQAGEYVRASGVIRQADPASTGDNPAAGTVLIDITSTNPNDQRWQRLGTGSPLPETARLNLSDVAAQGTAYTGTLIHVTALRKVSGEWPKLGDRSTDVTVTDDSGETAVLRFQRMTITTALSNKLEAIGNGPFAATAILVQDDVNPDGSRLTGFQLWVRGADDIEEK